LRNINNRSATPTSATVPTGTATATATVDELLLFPDGELDVCTAAVGCESVEDEAATLVVAACPAGTNRVDVTKSVTTLPEITVVSVWTTLVGTSLDELGWEVVDGDENGVLLEIKLVVLKLVPVGVVSKLDGIVDIMVRDSGIELLEGVVPLVPAEENDDELCVVDLDSSPWLEFVYCSLDDDGDEEAYMLVRVLESM
jgi:hypothetical protein